MFQLNLNLIHLCHKKNSISFLSCVLLFCILLFFLVLYRKCTQQTIVSWTFSRFYSDRSDNKVLETFYSRICFNFISKLSLNSISFHNQFTIQSVPKICISYFLPYFSLGHSLFPTAINIFRLLLTVLQDSISQLKLSTFPKFLFTLNLSWFLPLLTMILPFNKTDVPSSWKEHFNLSLFLFVKNS